MPLNIDWQQILLHLFNFVILAAGLYFLLYKPVVKFMDKRKEHYKSMDDEATEKVAKANEMQSDCNERLNQLDNELDLKRKEAETELEKEISEKIAHSKLHANKIVENAILLAEQEKEQVLNETRQEIATLATLATKKLLEQSASDALEQFLTAEERRGSDDRE